MALALQAGFVYFALIISAGLILGMLRVFVFLPRMASYITVLIELPVILVICWFAAKWVVKKFAVPAVVTDRLVMGASAFVFLMLAELSLAMVSFYRTLTGYLARLTTPEDTIGLAGQIFFAMFPYLPLRRSAIGD